MVIRSSQAALSYAGLALALLLAADVSNGEQSRPIDGGNPIDFSDRSGLAADPCERRERGGWHYSSGHCEEMTPPGRITGVWVTDVEAPSFLVGTTAMPDRNDPRRYMTVIEIDKEQVYRLIGRGIGTGVHAVAISFVGRRTRYPYVFGCNGVPYYAYVVDRLESARDFGTLAEADPPPLPSQQGLLRRTGAGGVIGRLEEDAVARCNRRLPPGSHSDAQPS